MQECKELGQSESGGGPMVGGAVQGLSPAWNNVVLNLC